MTASIKPGLIVLDSLAAFALCAGHELGVHLRSTYSLSAWQPAPVLAETAYGDVLALAAIYMYTSSQVSVLEKHLQSFQRVALNDQIISCYATFAGAFAHALQPLPSSKVWTIATLQVVSMGSLPATLLCCDPDYLILAGPGAPLLNVEYVDPNPFLPFPI